MDTVTAIYNHGRWVAICPLCAAEGVTSAVQVKPGDLFICPEENEDLLAMTYIPNPKKSGAFNMVPDDAKREEARQTALRLGHALEVIFPAEKAKIEAVLRARPVTARNWHPGETVAALIAENAEMGVA